MLMIWSSTDKQYVNWDLPRVIACCIDLLMVNGEPLGQFYNIMIQGRFKNNRRRVSYVLGYVIYVTRSEEVPTV